MSGLATAVYSAFRGYAWSGIPPGLTERLMDKLREFASENRGDFPDTTEVERGVVAIGPVAAAFTIRHVADWDSNGRASVYSAFAFFKSADAAAFNFGDLLRLPFFDIPTREAPPRIDYSGRPAEPAPLTAAGRLVCHQHLDSIPATQSGDLLAKYFTKSDQWRFRLNSDGTMSVDCAGWNRK